MVLFIRVHYVKICKGTLCYKIKMYNIPVPAIKMKHENINVISAVFVYTTIIIYTKRSRYKYIVCLF